MSLLPPVYSTLPAAAIASLVEAEYGLPSPRADLLRRGFNDSYQVTVGEERYVLRLYLHDKYYVQGPDDLRFELDLLDHLAAQGVGVATALPRRGGDRLGSVQAAEGLRHFALFHYAPGGHATTLTEAQVRGLGAALAQIHLAAESFRTAYHRHRLDRSALLDLPMQRMEPYLAGRPDDHQYVQGVAARVGAVLDGLDAGPGLWGIIHGDPHSGNAHFVEDRPVLFDFDTCGYGWRAYDLGIALRECEAAQRPAFLEAYQSIRPLSAAERDALPALLRARAIWDAGDIVTMTPVWGIAVARSVVGRMIKDLRALDGEFPW
ncbi:MAG: phosphotransferase [Bacillota bacterium]